MIKESYYYLGGVSKPQSKPIGCGTDLKKKKEQFQYKGIQVHYQMKKLCHFLFCFDSQWGKLSGKELGKNSVF